MKATVRPYRIPLTRPYRWAGGAQTERGGLLVAVEHKGSTGWGEVAPPIHERPDLDALQHAASSILERLTAPDAAALDRLDLHPRLRTGISTAFLDIAAKRQDLSVAAYMAQEAGIQRVAKEVPVNALIGAVPPDEAAAMAVSAQAAGHRTVKVKCTADRARDVARVQAVREALRPDTAIRIDANGAWRPAWALQHLQDLAPFDIAYVEQPVAPTELAGMARLRTASPIPIALDESAQDLAAVQAILEAEAADHLILKPQRLGGLDRTLAVVAAATDADVGCTITNSIETAVGRTATLHAAACLPEPVPDCGIGTEALLAADVSPDAPRVEAGRMVVPRSPGLGITVEVARIGG